MRRNWSQPSKLYNSQAKLPRPQGRHQRAKNEAAKQESEFRIQNTGDKRLKLSYRGRKADICQPEVGGQRSEVGGQQESGDPGNPKSPIQNPKLRSFPPIPDFLGSC